MDDRAINGSGAVAIHRWFAGGEGWAYHPWYAGQKHQLLSALKGELDTRRELESSGGSRRFAYQAMGGVLFGEQVSDPVCPDGAAAGRFPTVLRAVFLPGEPPEADREMIAGCLARLHARRAGADAGLRIEWKGPALPPRPPGPRRAWLYVGLVGLLLAGALLAWPQSAHNRSKDESSTEELRKAQARMEKLLRKWQVGGPSGTGGSGSPAVYGTASRFLHFLSQEDLDGKLGGDHPDACFARRLPRRGASPRTPQDLRLALKDLAAHLARDAGPPPAENRVAREKSLDAVLDEIDRQMDFASWWATRGSHLDYAVGAKAGPEVSKFACRFLDVDTPVDRANRSWQKPAAEKMASTLRGRWRVEAVTDTDCEKRPWFVIHCFFQLLSQRHIPPDDLRQEAWHVEFVKRLPKEPYTKDGRFGTEQELIDALRKLARDLRAEGSDTVSTLVTNIAVRMDYIEWKRKAEEVIRRDQETGPPCVERLVKHFSSRR